jgi:hypothetical protein
MDFKKAISTAQPMDNHLIYKLSTAKWERRILNQQDHPLCISRVPREKLIFAMASGDILVPVDYLLGDQTITVIAGMDSFRYDPQDDLPVNKDHFIVVPNNFRRDLEVSFLSLGPFKYREDHHLPDIPEDIFQIPTLV